MTWDDKRVNFGGDFAIDKLANVFMGGGEFAPPVKITETFKLPIEHVADKRKLDTALIDDIELTVTKTDVKPVYDILLEPKTTIGGEMVPLWAKYYTTDASFIRQTQEVVKTAAPEKLDAKLCDDVYKRWREIKGDTAFMSRFQFFDIGIFRGLNNSRIFMSAYSLYNFSSPVINLAIPLSFLILPFFIIKFVMKVPMTFAIYHAILKQQIQRHALGRIFFMDSVSLFTKMYLLMSAAMYVYSFYNNIRLCIKFYKNFHYIHETFDVVSRFITYMRDVVANHVATFMKPHSAYRSFVDMFNGHMATLNAYHKRIENIPAQFSIIRAFGNIGGVMSNYHYLYDNPQLCDAIQYAIGFNGYLDGICAIKQKLDANVIGTCEIVERDANRAHRIDGVYHPAIPDAVRNDVVLKKRLRKPRTSNSGKRARIVNRNHIITGPNASGKTSLLKSTLISVIMSQQFGMGYYKSAQLTPYDHIHCYLNIPDTSGRDSLFQAEARRCKDILSCMDEWRHSRHFCIFDELFSGTNPYEAIGSAYSYLRYLTENYDCTIMLTTHFSDLCQCLQTRRHFYNCHMNSHFINDKIAYKYTISAGISKVRGGTEVLKQLDFPDKIIRDTKTIIENL